MGYFGVGNASKSKSARKPIVKKLYITVAILIIFNLIFFYNPLKSRDISISDNSDDNEYEDSNFPIELSKNSLQLIQYPAGTHPVYRKWNSNINLNNRPKKILIWNAYWESTGMHTE